MIWGYYFILVLLIFERKAQSWIYNRYGVDESYKVKKVRTTRQEVLEREKAEKLRSFRMSLNRQDSRGGPSLKEALSNSSNKLDVEKL